MASLSLKILEEKAQEHERLFDDKERKRLQILRDYLLKQGTEDDGDSRSNSDSDSNTSNSKINSNYRDLANQVDQLLVLTKSVHKKVSKARKGELRASKMERTEELIDELVKEHEKLFDEGPYSQLVQHANRKARQQPEQVEQRREKQLRKLEEKRKKQEEEEKQRITALQEKKEKEKANQRAQEEEEARQREIKARRHLQHRCAGHPSAKTLWFSTIRISEHALFRWNDRGLSSTAFSEFLKEIDEGKIMYRLQPTGHSWEVQVSLPGQEEEIVLVLNKNKSTIITVLRDDEEYNCRENDHQYAPAGRIASEKCSLYE